MSPSGQQIIHSATFSAPRLNGKADRLERLARARARLVEHKTGDSIASHLGQGVKVSRWLFPRLVCHPPSFLCSASLPNSLILHPVGMGNAMKCILGLEEREEKRRGEAKRGDPDIPNPREGRKDKAKWRHVAHTQSSRKNITTDGLRG